MHRVDTSTAAAALPASDAAGMSGYFTKGDPLIPTPATVPGQDWFNAVQEELIAVVVEGGGVPDAAKANFTQLRDAIQAMIANNPSVPRGAIDGLILSNNGTVALDISAGIARDDGDAANMALAVALTNKQLNVAWAVGSAAGMLDTGAIAANSWYHIWLIRRSDTGVVDVLASLSATAPTMPASYDQKRKIGAVLTDATPDIIAFTQFGDEFLWDVPVADYSIINPGVSAVLRALTVPLGAKMHAIHSITLYDTAAANPIYLLATSPDQADTAPSSSIHTLNSPANGGSGSGGQAIFGGRGIRTDTSRQIRVRQDYSDAAIVLTGTTHGWIDPRGRDA